MIIGIAGKMGCGKDYICNNLVLPLLKKHGQSFLQVSFADQIKINVMTKHDVSFHDVYVSKNVNTRRLLQTEGTENGRNVLGDDIWIRYLDNWITVHKSRGIDHFVCTDVRFKNELDYIKRSGGIVIKIVSSDRNNLRLYKESNGDPTVMEMLRSHASECDLDNLLPQNFDIILNNDFNSDIFRYSRKIEVALESSYQKESQNNFTTLNK
jgi:hypothetical protein